MALHKSSQYMRRNSFLVNIVLLVSVNALIKPAYLFAVEIPVQNHVGNDVYGMYFTFLNLAYIFQLLNDLGLQNLTYSELPRDRSAFPRMLSNIVSLRAILAILFIAVMAISGYALGYWRLDSRLFALVTANVFLISCLAYVRSNLSGLGLYFKDSLISVVDKLLMLIVLAILLYGPAKANFDIFDFVLVQTFSFLFAIGVGMLILQSHVRWVRPVWREMRLLLKQALPYGILIALMFLYTRLDAIMIEIMLSNGLEEAGLYASAYRLYDAVAMISFLFATLLLPMFSELDENRGARSDLYYGSLNLIVGMSLLVSFPIILYNSEIMHWLYTSTSSGAIASVAILMLAFIFKGSLFVTSTLLTSARAFRVLIILFGSSILLNFVANLVLIPRIGIEGASWATFMSQFYIALGCVYLCHNRSLIQIKWRDYARISGFGLLVMALFLLLYFQVWQYNWLMVSFLVLSLAILYLIMNHKQMAQLSKRISRR